MMEKPLESFFFLLGCAIHQKDAADQLKSNPDLLKQLKETDWQEFAHLAASTKTLAVLYSTVSQCADMVGIDGALVKLWQKRSLGLMLRELDKYKSVYALLAEAKKRELMIVVFKGVILADLYPQYTQRTSHDMDIWVYDADKSSAVRMLEELGYCRDQKSSKDHVQVYVRSHPSHVVELHTRLWEDYEGEKINIIESMSLTSKETLIEMQVCGLDILALGHGQHLVYQIFHIIKHFMLEGVGIRYLIDIVLFVEAYANQIDFNLFWESMDSLGYTKFCRHLFAICIKYLGMDPGILKEENTREDPETRILLEDMLRAGPSYNKTAGWQILGAMTPYFTGEKEVRRSQMGRALDVIFLRPKDLTKGYSYAKKCVILLPIAWVHRAYKYLTGWLANKKYFYSINEKLDVTEHRLHLMSGLGLVNEKGKRTSG